MSVLEDLIKKHCPDGVEYVELNSVIDYEQPSKYIVQDTKYNNDYDVPVLTAGQSFILGYTNEKDGIYKANKKEPVIIFDDFTTSFHWVDFNFKVKSSAMKMLKVIDENKSNFRYLYYCMKNIKYIPIEHARQWIEKYSKFTIPLPPIEIQKEIVRILDEFILKIAELQELLHKEYISRKKQYEYYRDKLLTFNDNVPLKKLGDIAIDIYRGTGIKKDEVTEKGIPCVRYGEIYTKYNIWFDKCFSHTIEENIKNRKYFEYGDVLFAITGESVKEISKSCVYIGNDKCLAGGDIVVLKHNQNPKYMGYVLSTTNAQIQKSKGKVKSKVVHSSVPDISDIIIPVPPLEEQERIVKILDRFDALCNDISSGLPAEIEMRKKQYEYYRDKLLTFEEKKI